MNSYEKKKRSVYRQINHDGMKDYFVPVIATDIVTGKEYEFECVMDAETAGFARHSHIFACLSGKRKTTGGYFWRAKNDTSGS